MKNAIKFLSLIFLISLGHVSFGQQTVTGNLVDEDTGEPMIGANILIENTSTGTISDYDGNFTLEVDKQLPYNLVISLVGYASQTVAVTEPNQKVMVKLGTAAFMANEVVVSASRVEENILQSPVSIEKLGIKEITNSSAPDFYDEINNMKGVIRTQASLTFNTINTRGFATGGNTRFVQLQDGMDNAAPLLNFPTGNIVGISELDIKEIELVPGAASALYGPNAFNGILFMNSKDPWKYQGLSAQLKSGVTQGFNESNPLYGASIRYAKAINDKFAYKFNVSTFFATDWAADDYTTHVNTYDNSVLPTAVNFNGVNLYGDETNIPVGPGIRRTGFEEGFLLDNRKAESLKFDGALHYKLAEGIETNASYKYGKGSSVYQGSERYALRDLVQQFAKVEVNADNWNIRGYGSFTDDGDSYNMAALGAFANEAIFPSFFEKPLVVGGQEYPDIMIPGGWSVAANVASNFPGNNIQNAVNFADQGGFLNYTDAQKMGLAGGLLGLFDALPEALRLPAALQLIEQSIGMDRTSMTPEEILGIVEQVRNGLFGSGGAGFIDNSRMYHVEGNYDLTSKLDDLVGLQIGANVRRYDLFTEGTIFKELNQETGEFERIKIDEWGAYMQLTKEFGLLKLGGSIRYDKNQNFDGQFSPRLSAVYSLDEAKKHNLRASWQTGFRNPTTQGQYIFFPASQVLLGGTEENASFTNELDGSNFNIFEPGFAVAADGVTAIDLDYVKPEQLTAFEVGYKGIIGSNLFLDVNYYHNIYEDFINQLTVISTQDLMYRGNRYNAGTAWFPYTNVPITFSSDGIDLGMRYKVDKNWAVSGNYSFAGLNFDSEKLESTSFAGSDFNPGFNTPENKFGLGVQCKELIKHLGLGVNYRWQQDFFYSSAFGRGTIPAYQTVDASLSYRLPSLKSVVKLGMTNLLKEKYTTNVGNPFIGRTIVLTITYDQFGAK